MATLAKINDALYSKLRMVNGDNLHSSGNSLMSTPGFYTGPPPSAPTCSIPKIISANILAQYIIISIDKLFFVSKRIGSSVPEICKWQLIRVALAATMSSYPSRLKVKDGKYVLTFMSRIHTNSGIMRLTIASGCNTMVRMSS
jgi:hypothetical protein